MKKIILIALTWVWINSLKAQIVDTVKSIVSIKNHVLVNGGNSIYYISKNLTSFGSITNKTQKLVFDERLTKQVYYSVFKDSTIYNTYKNILSKEGIFNPLLKINKCFVGNNILLFCSGVNLKATINRLGQPDYLMYPFYFVLTLSRDSFTVKQISPIGDLPNENYYLLEVGDFFEKNDTIHFTIARDEIIGNSSKILASWIHKGNDSLIFNKYNELNIPKYFKLNNIGYNLISYAYSNGYILFNTLNSIFNVQSGEEISLKVKTPSNIYRDVLNGDVEINAVNISFEIADKFIYLLRRQNKEFYYSKFKLADGGLVQNIKLPDSIAKCILDNDNTTYINNGILHYVDEQQKNIVRYKLE